MTPDPSAEILNILATVSETDEVRTDPELALYDLQILDSMKTVELIRCSAELAWCGDFARGIRARSVGHAAPAGGRRAPPAGDLNDAQGWFEKHPRTRLAAVTLYYLAIIAGLIMLYGRGDFSTPAFVYQAF